MTASEPKRFSKTNIKSYILALFLSIGILVTLHTIATSQQQECDFYFTDGGERSCLHYEKADTIEKQIKGLSGRHDLAKNQAMLFEFGSQGKKCMWMKDMNFVIDIIWLDGEKKITHVERNVKPDTYPELFCGSGNDMFVIETATNAIPNKQIQIGKHINL